MNPRILALAAISAGIGGMFREGVTGEGGTAGTGTAAATPAIVIPPGMKGEVFHFRKEKVTAKDEATGEEKVIETFKRPSATIPLPVPTKEELLAIFTAPSEGEGNRAAAQKYILDVVYDQLYLQAREQINAAREDNENNKEFKIDANIIDYSKLTIEALANMPASERGNKVAEEDMTAFIADYVSIMPAALQKDAAKIKAQAGLLEKGLRTVKTDKKVLAIMEQCLTVWAATTGGLEEHQNVYEMLTNRIKKWVSATPKNVLDSIM